MICYRIVRAPYQDDLSGEGAEKYGGRWNSIGTAALYCCENRSLALLEVLANSYSGIVLKNFVILTIEIPESAKIWTPKASQLPSDWQVIPLRNTSQNFGDKILSKTEYIGFKVPSTIMPYEHNFVFNPQHVDFKKVKIKEKTPFTIDARL